MKRKLCFVLGMLMCLLALLSGCSSPGGAPATTAQPGETSQDPVALTLMSMYYVAEPPNREDINELIAEVTGYSLDIIWVPSSGYNEKLNTMIASDTLPMISIISNPKENAFVEACRAGMFWEISEYVDQYPHISKMNKNVLESTMTDGGLYGIFRERDLSRQGIIFREDWMIELGLERPETYDDVVEMIRAFATKSKYGVASFGGGNTIPRGVDYLAVWNGAPNNWAIGEDGVFYPKFMHEAFKDAMDLFREFYRDGITNSNYIELSGNDNNAMINAEETGLIFSFTDDLQNRFTDLEIVNPDAKLSYILGVEGKDGVKRGIATSGFNGLMSFSKTAVKTEQDLMHCIDFVDKTGLPEYIDLFAWGIEGVDYELVDGVPDRTNEPYASKYASSAGQYGLIRCFGDIGNLKGKIMPIMQEIINERPLWQDYLVFDASTAYISDTYNILGGDLDQVINDAINKYIIGTIDEAAWEKAKQDWLDMGGQAVIDEYTAASK